MDFHKAKKEKWYDDENRMVMSGWRKEYLVHVNSKLVSINQLKEETELKTKERGEQLNAEGAKGKGREEGKEETES
ncbi:hypothetical protein P7K49_027367 [Saguinus oedipus]|uniref:Uncharacterized protein n=1 Tax=Saguinus oedipus TaxID=9490 RepID=A0ABQ9U998_SAGOE|nr:hypothetical protein P7K49_027367 [Saguinus oedipus]